LRPLADTVQGQSVLLELEAVLRRNPLLALLDGGVVEFFHPAALQTDQVIVV
jgi:hypothetical protein